MTEISSSRFTDVDGSDQILYGIWYPLFDTPVNVRLSREQLQGLQEALRGEDIVPGWREHFATQIEAVLRMSLREPDPAPAPAVKCGVCYLAIRLGSKTREWVHSDTGMSAGYVFRPHYAHPE